MSTVFDLQGTEQQRAIIAQAIARCTFPFERLLPGLRREVNRESIPVEWADLTRYAGMIEREHGHAHVHEGGDKAHVLEARQQVLGLAWYSGRVTIEQSLVSRPELAAEVFLSEGAHMVDFFYLTDAQRDAIFSAYHGGGETPPHDHGWFDVGGYGDWVGESFMAGFTLAFSDLEPIIGGFTHPTTRDVAEVIRVIVLGEPEVQPFRVFALARSSVFHDAHRGIAAEQTFETRAAAIASGRRPCGVCRP